VALLLLEVDLLVLRVWARDPKVGVVWQYLSVVVWRFLSEVVA
jgi:hypothetical protein